MDVRVVLAVVGMMVCALVFPSPQIGLGIGAVLALVGLGWTGKWAGNLSRWLIRGCIVLLGFTIDLEQVSRAGLSGIAFTVATLVLAFVVGAALAKMLKVEGKLATLICAGTAVCGGSAIVATSAVIRVSRATMSIAFACVFILNVVALYAFPAIGRLLDLSEHQFGAWAAVAIHDVASVVGAGEEYGPIAKEDATVIKLTRVLWLAPMIMAIAWFWKRRDATAALANGNQITGEAVAKPSRWKQVREIVPGFIVLFLLASAVRTQFVELAQYAPGIRDVTKAGLSVALFLIGSGLSVKAIREVGWRAMAMAAGLWVVMCVISLVVVRATVL